MEGTFGTVHRKGVDETVPSVKISQTEYKGRGIDYVALCLAFVAAYQYAGIRLVEPKSCGFEYSYIFRASSSEI